MNRTPTSCSSVWRFWPGQKAAYLLCSALLAGTGLGCGDDDALPDAQPTADSGGDNGIGDNGVGDSGGLDSGPDSGPPDSGTDGNVRDGGPDAPMVDSGPDAPPDSGPDPACAAGEYIGNDDWTGRLVVERGAQLCAYLRDRGGTDATAIPRLLRDKSVITPVAGTYAMPTSDQAHAFLVPMCVRDRTGDALPVTMATSVRARRDSFIGIGEAVYVWADMNVDEDALEFGFAHAVTEAEFQVRNAPIPSHLFGATATRNEQFYASCHLQANRCAEFDLSSGGRLRLDEYGWQASPGAGFGALTHVQGTVGDVAVDIEDYASLTTSYGHHAFDRYHFIRFASPVEGHCALRVDIIENSEGGADIDYAFADCEGRATEAFHSVTGRLIDCSS